MKIRQSSYLTILLISYIAILLISLFSGIFDYLSSKKIMEDEVFRSNSAILKQACTYIDTVLEQEELLLIDIGLNTKINSFINVKEPISESEQYDLYNLIKDMSIYKNKYPYISEYYIYFENTDRVVTSSSVYNSKMFYEYIYGYEEFSYDEWKTDILSGYHENTFILPMEMKQKPNGKYITYVRSLPIYLKQNIKATLVVLVDEQVLISLLGDLKWLNNGIVYIVDNNGEIITSSTSEIQFDNLTELQLDGDEGYSVIKTDMGNMALSYVSSEQHGWKYVSLMPLEIYMEKVFKNNHNN